MELRNEDFAELVKRTREKFGMSIDEAHDLIFADEGMRRLVAWRINNDFACRKQALQDLREKGDGSRFIRKGDRIAFRTVGCDRAEELRESIYDPAARPGQGEQARSGRQLPRAP